MLDVRKLEQRWLRYKLKQYIPHLVSMTSLVVIAGAITFFLTSDIFTSVRQTYFTSDLEQTSPPTTAAENKASKNVQPQPVVQTVTPQRIVQNSTPETLEKKVVLRPSLNFVTNIPEHSSYQPTNPPAQIHQKVLHPKQNIVIIKKNSLQDLKDAERRFKLTNSPALSLFLAKQYYTMQNFSKSYNYALMTNQLDKENEESWLLVAKSLVKLGKRTLATNALAEYIKFSNSKNAEMLLHDISTGKFQ